MLEVGVLEFKAYSQSHILCAGRETSGSVTRRTAGENAVDAGFAGWQEGLAEAFVPVAGAIEFAGIVGVDPGFFTAVD